MATHRGGTRGTPASDEIGLDELILALAARWWLFVLFGAVAAGAAAWYASARPVLFEYRTGIEIGYVYLGEQGDDERVRAVDPADMAYARLEDYIVPTVRRDWREAGRAVPSVAVEERGGGGGFLLISEAAEYAAAEVAELHRSIGQRLAETHEQLLQRQVALLQRPLSARADILERQLAAVDAQLATLHEDRLSAEGGDAALVALVNAQRAADLGREHATLLGALAEVRAQAEAVEAGTFPTRLAFIGSRSDQPVNVATGVLVILAGVLGLLLAAFLTLIWELIARARSDD